MNELNNTVNAVGNYNSIPTSLTIEYFSSNNDRRPYVNKRCR